MRRRFAVAVAAALLLVAMPGTSYAADIDRWHLDFLHSAEAHAISQGEGVTVAVIDSGVDASHPDLAGSVLPGFNPDSVGAADGRSDAEGHGTAMALLIAGHGTSLGIAPKAKILPIRASDTNSIARGIDWAVAHGAHVINISSGSAGVKLNQQLAVERALAAGVVVVASAGNVPPAQDVDYPAAYEGVIAAAAVDRTGGRAAISVSGDRVVLAAPGDRITTVFANGTPRQSSGTSDSSALIAGVAALVKAKFPNLSGREIYHRLVMTADDKGVPGRDAEYGYGIVNPVRALTADVPPLVQSPSPNPDGTPQAPQGQPASGSGFGLVLPILFAVFGLALVALVVLVAVFIYRSRTTARR